MSVTMNQKVDFTKINRRKLKKQYRKFLFNHITNVYNKIAIGDFIYEKKLKYIKKSIKTCSDYRTYFYLLGYESTTKLLNYNSISDMYGKRGAMSFAYFQKYNIWGDNLNEL